MLILVNDCSIGTLPGRTSAFIVCLVGLIRLAALDNINEIRRKKLLKIQKN